MSAAEKMFGMKFGRKIVRGLIWKDGKKVMTKTIVIIKPSRVDSKTV